MAWIINCECGVVVRGETDEELVSEAQKHAREAHAMEITPEQAMAVAEPA